MNISSKYNYKKRKLDESPYKFDNYMLESIMNGIIKLYYSTIDEIKNVIIMDNINLDMTRNLVDNIKINKSSITVIDDNHIVNYFHSQYGVNTFNGTIEKYFSKKSDRVCDLLYINITDQTLKYKTLYNMFINKYVGIGTILVLNIKTEKDKIIDNIFDRMNKYVVLKKMEIKHHIRLKYDDTLSCTELLYISEKN